MTGTQEQGNTEGKMLTAEVGCACVSLPEHSCGCSEQHSSELAE